MMCCPNCDLEYATFTVTKYGALVCTECENYSYVMCNTDGDWYLS